MLEQKNYDLITVKEVCQKAGVNRSTFYLHYELMDDLLEETVSMAAYTTYKITMASVHLKRRKRSSNSLIHLLRTISFIDALVSILSLQNTLIMVNMKDESTEMLTLSAMTSAAIMLAVLAISIAAMRKGVIELKSKE